MLSTVTKLAFAAGVGLFAWNAAGPGATAIKPVSRRASDDDKVEFNRDIRPILGKCTACHGNDPNSAMAGLMIFKRDTLVSKRDDGNIPIVPGKPDQSELVKRIFSTDKNKLMPPPFSNKTLSADEKKMLRQWIVEGAEYKEHWGFVKPERPTPPPVKDTAWPKSDIDRFVLARMEDKGLHPSPEADRRTLIRRVSMDLDGLPPTPQEVEDFVADKSPNAYEKVVDRLLASPRYGERMASDWMDYARYADSNGYQADYERFQWRWRDWVIDAFNKDMPYDQFTIKQIAGDLLPNATMDDRLATGFNRNHRINTEGGVIPEEWRVETVIDRVETTSETWLGLTAGCARCHDHKYDPITQKDFYSLFAYFNNVPESGTGVEQPVNHPPIMKAPTPWQETKELSLEASLRRLDRELEARAAKNLDASQNWQPVAAAPIPDTAVLAHFSFPSSEAKANGKVTYDAGRYSGAVKTDDNSFLDLGNVADFDTHQAFSYALWVNPMNGEGAPISKMDVGHAYRGWDLFLQGGRPAMHLIDTWPSNALKVVSKAMLPNGQWSHIVVTYDGSAKASGVHIYVNGAPTETETEMETLTGTAKTTTTTKVGRRTTEAPFNGQVDDLNFYSRSLTADEAKGLANSNPAVPILGIPVEKRTAAQKLAIAKYWSAANDPAYKELAEQRGIAEKDRNDLDGRITTVMVMQEMPKPRDAFILQRGQYDKHLAKVTAAVPAFLPPLPKGAPNNRLGLAEWIVSPENPLATRVAVNRMWERLFGTGIVETSEDFGTRASFPTHPQLLDWMATEFLRLKWDQKAMWKELVMSATYRQSSNVTPELIAADPTNKFLARGPRFRLTGEEIRDQALYASGLLKEIIGGPSVYPYQPSGVWDDINVYGNLRNYHHAIGNNLYRRSLYTIWKRTSAPPAMTLFDVPSRETCIVRRARTDTPLQALALLNDVTYLEAARALAQRMIEEGGKTEASRIAFGFESLLSRKPTAMEAEILGKSLDARLAQYQTNPKSAEELLSQGETQSDPKLDRAELAAYTVSASTMLNLDETLNKN